MTPALIPDVYAGQPLIVSGRYGKAGRATVTVSATTGGRRVTIPVDVSLPSHVELPAVPATWARRRIDELMLAARDGVVPSDVEQEVTGLGLRYHLVTEFTSFVAVDRTRVVQPGGATETIEQPALAPEGVNLAAAVGGIGAVHLATAGLVELAVLTGLVTVAGCVAAMRRLTVLRVAGTPLPAWEPAVLTVSSCLLALSVIFAG